MNGIPEVLTCISCDTDLRHPAPRECENWWSHDDDRPRSEREPWELEREPERQPRKAALTAKAIASIDFPEPAQTGRSYR